MTDLMDDDKPVTWRQVAMMLVGAWAVAVAACFGLLFAWRALLGLWK